MRPTIFLPPTARAFLALGACALVALTMTLGPAASTAWAKKKKADTGAAESLAPLFYPPLPQQPRYQFLGTVTSSKQFQKKGGLGGFLFGQDRGAIDLKRPYGVAMRDGKLYVCDSGAHLALVFDTVEGTVSSFNVDHPQLGLSMPINVSFGAGGRKWVTDARAGKLLLIDEDDRPQRLFLPARLFDLGGAGGLSEVAADCPLPNFNPVAAVEHEGEVFVADLATSSILVLDAATGCQLRRLGGQGEGDGQFMKPTNLAVGPQGYLYVSDTVNARVQKIDREGRFVQSFGSLGVRMGQMVRPKGVAVDEAGRLYVVDAATQVVQVFNADGQLLLALGQPGNDRGGLSLPAGIAIADDEASIAYGQQLAAPGFQVEYLLLVSNQLGPNKINLYAFGQYGLRGDGSKR